MKKLLALNWSDVGKPYRWKVKAVNKNGAGGGGA